MRRSFETTALMTLAGALGLAGGTAWGAIYFEPGFPEPLGRFMGVNPAEVAVLAVVVQAGLALGLGLYATFGQAVDRVRLSAALQIAAAGLYVGKGVSPDLTASALLGFGIGLCSATPWMVLNAVHDRLLIQGRERHSDTFTTVWQTLVLVAVVIERLALAFAATVFSASWAYFLAAAIAALVGCGVLLLGKDERPSAEHHAALRRRTRVANSTRALRTAIAQVSGIALFAAIGCNQGLVSPLDVLTPTVVGPGLPLLLLTCALLVGAVAGLVVRPAGARALRALRMSFNLSIGALVAGLAAQFLLPGQTWWVLVLMALMEPLTTIPTTAAWNALRPYQDPRYADAVTGLAGMAKFTVGGVSAWLGSVAWEITGGFQGPLIVSLVHGILGRLAIAWLEASLSDRRTKRTLHRGGRIDLLVLPILPGMGSGPLAVRGRGLPTWERHALASGLVHRLDRIRIGKVVIGACRPVGDRVLAAWLAEQEGRTADARRLRIAASQLPAELRDLYVAWWVSTDAAVRIVLEHSPLRDRDEPVRLLQALEALEPPSAVVHPRYSFDRRWRPDATKYAVAHYARQRLEAAVEEAREVVAQHVVLLPRVGDYARRTRVPASTLPDELLWPRLVELLPGGRRYARDARRGHARLAQYLLRLSRGVPREGTADGGSRLMLGQPGVWLIWRGDRIAIVLRDMAVSPAGHGIPPFLVRPLELDAPARFIARVVAQKDAFEYYGPRPG
jgi:hypothetical protein